MTVATVGPGVIPFFQVFFETFRAKAISGGRTKIIKLTTPAISTLLSS